MLTKNPTRMLDRAARRSLRSKSQSMASLEDQIPTLGKSIMTCKTGELDDLWSAFTSLYGQSITWTDLVMSVAYAKDGPDVVSWLQAAAVRNTIGRNTTGDSTAIAAV